MACFMETSRKRGIQQQHCMVWFVRYVPQVLRVRFPAPCAAVHTSRTTTIKTVIFIRRIIVCPEGPSQMVPLSEKLS